jgi:hypothetical protein
MMVTLTQVCIDAVEDCVLEEEESDDDVEVVDDTESLCWWE